MIRPLCKQFKQSAMPEPVKRQTPNVSGVVCPSKSKACAYAWGNGRDCGAGKDCYVQAKGWGLVAKRKEVSVWLAERQENGKA